MKTYDYFLYVVSSLPQSVCVGYVDNTLPSLLYITMILRVRRKFFEITTFPNSLLLRVRLRRMLHSTGLLSALYST